MTSVIYIFHIASLYDRHGDRTAGADMIVHSSKTALHDVTNRIMNKEIDSNKASVWILVDPSSDQIKTSVYIIECACDHLLGLISESNLNVGQ